MLKEKVIEGLVPTNQVTSRPLLGFPMAIHSDQSWIQTLRSIHDNGVKLKFQVLMLRVYKENATATLSHIKATKRSYCRSVCFQLYVL